MWFDSLTTNGDRPTTDESWLTTGGTGFSFRSS